MTHCRHADTGHVAGSEGLCLNRAEGTGQEWGGKAVSKPYLIDRSFHGVVETERLNI